MPNPFTMIKNTKSKWWMKDYIDEDRMFLIYKNNVRDINFFTKKFTN